MHMYSTLTYCTALRLLRQTEINVMIITQKALKLLLQFEMMAVAVVVVVVMKISKILLSSRGKLEKK